MTVKLGQALQDTVKQLRAAGVEAARLEAELLLMRITGLSRAQLWTREETMLSPVQRQALAELVAARCQRRPLAYVLGEKEFMGLAFRVTPAVLIPRPETELLVERIVADLSDHPAPWIADVGTGSGAIVVSLAVLLPRARLWATDYSGEALTVARLNACRHRVTIRCSWQQGDLLGQWQATLTERLDWVAANLPYIPRGELGQLQPEVQFEPRLALDGGEDGLDLYRRLLPQAWRVLKPGGRLGMEIDCRQGAALSALCREVGWREVEIVKDYAGLDRFVLARKPEREG
ncbi:release factor glutamine methyltransferase [Carboxydocella sporoproducens DSM 16521]|uniref:Release factor glutamine methyltransferase n=2 Tax=Carboxydocella TaxID=178898 RepID=A0A1T4RHE7_9FIRM|nr:MULTISPECIES: peptide chain release factor N(5)-glutamine methyltransferase [Carboxydocella]AVX19533.1 [protein release factor]-glutamine N5-methyltransferase [Carboxydocella thermautotrophica]SKA15226.1 release factor glutamine methyltransferase [Carboxydocella sporoproducens DSM 16521]